MPFIIVSIENYLMLIYPGHQVFPNIICSVYIVLPLKQAGLKAIKSKAFSNLQLSFVPSQCLPSNSLCLCYDAWLCSFMYPYIFALNATNSVTIFPPNSSFIISITTCFFLFVKASSHPFIICLYQTLSLYLLPCLCKNLLSLSHTQNCLCSYSVTLPSFHTSAAGSHSGTYIY